MAAKGEARRLVNVPFFRWLSNLFTLSVDSAMHWLCLLETYIY